jgi:hypothetical protein
VDNVDFSMLRYEDGGEIPNVGDYLKKALTVIQGDCVMSYS